MHHRSLLSGVLCMWVRAYMPVCMRLCLHTSVYIRTREFKCPRVCQDTYTAVVHLTNIQI